MTAHQILCRTDENGGLFDCVDSSAHTCNSRLNTLSITCGLLTTSPFDQPQEPL
jgi:hypothetical protein